MVSTVLDRGWGEGGSELKKWESNSHYSNMNMAIYIPSSICTFIREYTLIQHQHSAAEGVPSAT